tara:strand:- start:74 stop:307 length:234 start_codon:yes stop_codon:yes gene_type:complete
MTGGANSACQKYSSAGSPGAHLTIPFGNGTRENDPPIDTRVAALHFCLIAEGVICMAIVEGAGAPVCGCRGKGSDRD